MPSANPGQNSNAIDGAAIEAGWLDAITRRVREEPRVTSLVLIGSSARGEAVGRVGSSGWQRYSDIELFAVTDGRLGGGRQARLRAGLASLAASWGQESRHFGIDIAFRERTRLASLPPSLFTHELREAGSPLLGPDARAEVPAVGLTRLDLADLRAILFKRLWHLAEGLPRGWVQGRDLSEASARDLGVTLSRQPLDVPTVLLPHAGVLAVGYLRRQALWDGPAAAGPRRGLDERLAEDSARYLAGCLTRRAACEPALEPMADLGRAAGALAAGLSWLLDAGRGEERGRSMVPAGSPAALDALADRLVRGGGGLFTERAVSPREALAAAKLNARCLRGRGPVAWWSWRTRPRKLHLAAGLLRLHAALLAGDAAGGRALLRRAAADFRVCCLAPAPVEPTAFADLWLATRLLGARAFWQTARLGAPSAWTAIERRLE